MTEPVKLLRAVRGNTLPIYLGVDYTGKIINAWTVEGTIRCVRPAGNASYKTDWLCNCSCGSAPQWVNKINLIKGKTTGCFACLGTRNSGKDNPNWKGFGEIPGEAFNKVRWGAGARGIPLNVSPSDLHDLWLTQDRRCALSGMALAMGDTASLDRIDSLLPYAPGNIQWVHKDVNLMKNAFPEEDFIEMCRRVADHHRQPLPQPTRSINDASL